MIMKHITVKIGMFIILENIMNKGALTIGVILTVLLKMSYLKSAIMDV